MAIQIKNTYSGRTDNTDPNYPWGKGRNVVGGVEGTGTPFEADWYNNLEGFLQGLLLEAGVTPDGDVDNANSSQLVEAVKGIITNDFSSILSVVNTTSLKNMTLSNGENFTIKDGEVVYARTQCFNNLFDNGGAFYKCLSLSAERNAREEQDWEPTGYDSFYIGSGNTTVAVLVPDKELYLETFGIFPYSEDCLERFNLILSYEKPVRTTQKDVSFKLSDVIFPKDLTIDMDLNGCYLIANGSEERCLLALNYLGEVKNIEDISFSSGRTKFTVATGHGIKADDKIKTFSNQVINPFSAYDRQRCAEYFVVESVTDTTIVCIGKHIWNYAPTDNPRLCKLKSEKTCTLNNIKVGRHIPHNGDFSVAIDIQGYYKPKINNIHADNFPGQLLSVRSCYRARMENISADFLLDDTGTMAVGYVGVDYGSQESEWYGLNGGKVRHTYTTGADSINADTTNPRQYGGAVRCHVYTGVTVGATNFAYDTHQDAWECEFHDITVYDDYSNTYASAGAYQERAQNNVVHKLTHISDGSDISAGQRTVMYNTGARNSHIKEIIYKGTSSSIVSSFGLGASFTDKKQHFRIDKIRVYQEKGAPRICNLDEPIGIDIGSIDVYPWDANRDFYGSGGDSYFGISNEEADLTVHEMNLWFDRNNLPPIITAGAYLFKIEGSAGRIKINLNTYTNSNTFTRFEGALSGIRSPTTVSTIKDCVLHWNAHVLDYDPDTMSKTSPIINGDELSSTNNFDNIKYTYKILGDGILKTGSYTNKSRGIFEDDMHLETYDRTQFGIASSVGLQIDYEKEVSVSGQALASSIASIDKPSFVGQILNITHVSWNETGVFSDIVLKGGATNTDLEVDRVLKIGEHIRCIAYELQGNLVWAIPR